VLSFIKAACGPTSSSSVDPYVMLAPDVMHVILLAGDSNIDPQNSLIIAAFETYS
jgi:hypothetical protein